MGIGKGVFERRRLLGAWRAGSDRGASKVTGRSAFEIPCWHKVGVYCALENEVRDPSAALVAGFLGCASSPRAPAAAKSRQPHARRLGPPHLSAGDRLASAVGWGSRTCTAAVSAQRLR